MGGRHCTGGNGGTPRAVHPFPARMSLDLARGLIEEAEAGRAAMGRDDPMTIVDPMVGSGTVLAAARQRGHSAIGFDVDPLAVLISEVGHCGTFDADAVHDVAERVLASARDVAARTDEYNGITDVETREFIEYWFDGTAASQLGALAAEIAAVGDCMIRNVLWCAFSRLIIAKQSGASRAADLAHSRPHRVRQAASSPPLERFERSVHAVMHAVADRFAPEQIAPSVAVGDARRIGLPPDSADMVLTSPPYVNAIDYLRCSKFSLVWMGHGIDRLRRIRSTAIGAEVGLRDAGCEVNSIISAAVGRDGMVALGSRRLGILARYAADIQATLTEVKRVLRVGGTATFVVGENVLRGTTVRTPRMVRAAAKHVGLAAGATRYRDIPPSRRYLPPPSEEKGAHRGHNQPLEARVRREAIVVLQKS